MFPIISGLQNMQKKKQNLKNWLVFLFLPNVLATLKKYLVT